MPSLADLRQTFLTFFAQQGHTVVDSSPLVPRNDPTLMFTNAGMVQFKNVFTGAETRPYRRATTAQKCVRAGGKHNDLENVGYTARHHTFFEMLGNFSFGDYFKEEAIAFAWELVTQRLGLPRDRLLVTVFHEDEEAARLWKKIAGLPEERIIRIATSANFWRMADTGPCGPCSEIFFDQGPALAGGPPGSPDEDGDRFLEFWNLVFMQFEERADGSRVPLPKPSVDTGMGLERLAALLQGVPSNYDIDLFQALIGALAGLVSEDPAGPNKASFRVIADHLRATAFLIADGVLPSNEGRGYVLRRIMRRAMRHARKLGAREPMLYRLAPELGRQMGAAYPELLRAEPLIVATLQLEETRFLQALDKGLHLLEDEAGRLAPGVPLSGEVAFKLYDTFGFPLDLTQDIARGRGQSVDTAGFDAAMTRQKAAARKAWAGSGDVSTNRVWFEVREAVGATEFLGYSTEEAEGRVVALVRNGQQVQAIGAGEDALIVVNQSPFYAESGGQTGDTGTLTTKSGVRGVVHTTHKEAGVVWVHATRLEAGTLNVGDVVKLTVDSERRAGLRAHHSATHLLHAALRYVLGEHVTQKGSLVLPDRLRFDFSHATPVPPELLGVVERIVNEQIRGNAEVTTRLMGIKEAMSEGAMALFGEKYGDEVRVVAMGDRVETHQDPGVPLSVELCGGTHARRTGDIGALLIVSEGGVSAGVRRIEAVVGAAALTEVTRRTEALQGVADVLKVSPTEAAARAQTLTDDKRRLEREVADLRRRLAVGGSAGQAGPASGNGPSGLEGTKIVGDTTFCARLLGETPARELKSMADALKAKIGSGVVALAAPFEGKASLVVAVTPDLVARWDAVALVRVGAEALGGQGGGGRPDMAQAGGPRTDALAEALQAVERAMQLPRP